MHGLKIICLKSAVLIIEKTIKYLSTIPEIFNSMLKVEVAGQRITIEQTARKLGVFYDQHLSFKRHRNQLSCIALMNLKNWNQFRNILPSKVKWHLVESLIISQLNYCVRCNVVYSSHLLVAEGAKRRVAVRTHQHQ